MNTIQILNMDRFLLLANTRGKTEKDFRDFFYRDFERIHDSLTTHYVETFEKDNPDRTEIDTDQATADICFAVLEATKNCVESYCKRSTDAILDAITSKKIKYKKSYRYSLTLLSLVSENVADIFK